MSDPEHISQVIGQVLEQCLPASLPAIIIERLETIRAALAEVAIEYRVLFSPQEQRHLNNAVDSLTAFLLSLGERVREAKEEMEAAA